MLGMFFSQQTPSSSKLKCQSHTYNTVILRLLLTYIVAICLLQNFSATRRFLHRTCSIEIYDRSGTPRWGDCKVLDQWIFKKSECKNTVSGHFGLKTPRHSSAQELYKKKKAVLSQRWPHDALLLWILMQYWYDLAIKVRSSDVNKGAWQMPCRNYGLRPGLPLVSQNFSIFPWE